MAFIRFVRSSKIANQGSRAGIFTAAYEVLRTSNAGVHRERIADLLEWFQNQLALPDRFNSSRSKGAWRRETKGLSWFRDDALEALDRAYELTALLQELDVDIEVIVAERVGVIVYQDDLQVVAEPFADTPT